MADHAPSSKVDLDIALMGDRAGTERARRRVGAGPYLLVAAATVYFARSAETQVAGTRTWVLFDDAMISMRYARNLADGHGLVWNARQPPVEGVSNLLWTLWMAALHVILPASTVGLFVILTSGVLLGGTVALSASVAHELSSERSAAPQAAAWLTAACYPVAFWALRGMEVGLTAFLLTAAVLSVLRIRGRGGARADVVLALLAAAATLTRLDLVAPLALIALWAVSVSSARVRTGGALIAGMGGAVAAQTVFRLTYYGSLLPNTYYLKLTGIPLGDRLQRGGLALAAAAVTFAVPAAVCAVGCRARRDLLLAVGVFGVCCAYSVYVGGDAWEKFGFADRYVAQALPLLLCAAAVTVCTVPRQLDRVVLAAGLAAAVGALVLIVSSEALMERLWIEDDAQRHLPVAAAAGIVIAGLWWVVARRRAPAAWLAAALAGFVVIGPLVGQARHGPYYMPSDRYEVSLGVALRDALPPGTSIAVLAAGSIPYYSQLPAVDLLGKSDPVVAHSAPHEPFRPGHDKYDFAYSIGVLRPDVVAQVLETPAVDRDLASWGYQPVIIDGQRMFALPGAVRAGDASMHLNLRGTP